MSLMLALKKLFPNKKSLYAFSSFLIISSFIFSGVILSFSSAQAAFNKQINYQGKLTNTSNVAVSDGTYNMEFKLYTAGGTPVWTETLTGGNKVQVTNGIFSVMLGSVSSLASVDFNQTLYLGVNIGGMGSAIWDGEMSPRKILGAVPAAFEAQHAANAEAFNNLNSSQFLRSDAVNATSTASTYLIITQNGSGKVAEFFGPNALSALSVNANGLVNVGGDIGVVGDGYFGGALHTQTSTGSGDALFIGNDSKLVDINIGNVAGLNGTSDANVGGLRLGNSGGTIYGYNNNIGIGDATPSQKLSVAGNGLFSGSVTADSFFSHDLSITFGGANSNIVNANSGLYLKANNAVGLIAGSSYQLTAYTTGVNIDGTLGIGTTTPSQKLSVAGNGLFSGSVTASSFIGDGSALTGINQSQWTTSGSNIYYNGGNVGIGTTSPYMKLSVNGNAVFGDRVQSVNSFVTSNSASSMGYNTYYDPNSTWSNVNPSDGGSFFRMTSGGMELYTSTSGTNPTITSRASFGQNSYFNGNVGIGTTNPRTALDTGTGVMSGAANDYIKAQFTMSGGGTVSWGGGGGRLKWTNRFIAIPVSQTTSVNGYIDINQPTSDISAANVYNGVARSATADGVVLNGWEALWAVHTPGGNNGQVSYYITTYTNSFNAPSNWILVAAVSGDDNAVKLGIGYTLKAGSTFAAGTDSQYALNNGSGNYIQNQNSVDQTANFRINGNGSILGNLGIGTTNPLSNLHVANGLSGITPYNSVLTIDKQAGADTLLSLLSTHQTGILFGNSNSPYDAGIFSGAGEGIDFRTGNNIDRLRIAANGNVGIGTINPLAKLNVANGAIFASDSSNDSGVILGGGEGTYGSIQASNATNNNFTNLIFQKYGGNVGIGTTSPSAKLSVSGTSLVTGLATFTGGITSPGIGASSEQFGAGASTGSGIANVAVGANAINSGIASVAVGNGASSGNGGTAIGFNAIGATNFGTALGYGSNAGSAGTALGASSDATGYTSVAIGNAASATFQTSAAIGFFSQTTANNQLILGGQYPGNFGYNDIYVGNGVTNSFIANTTINGTGGSGTNIAGANLTVAGGKATGNAAGGAVIFSTSDEGPGETTLQTLTEKMRIAGNGNVGIGATTPVSAFEIKKSAPVLTISNTGDASVRGYIGNDFATMQLGFQTVSSGVRNSYFGINPSGVVGSLNNTFGASTYRNILDNGSGQASFSGNVGIGTTNPQAKLSVMGGSLVVGNTVDTGGNGAELVIAPLSGTTAGIRFQRDGFFTNYIKSTGDSIFLGGNPGTYATFSANSSVINSGITTGGALNVNGGATFYPGGNKGSNNARRFEIGGSGNNITLNLGSDNAQSDTNLILNGQNSSSGPNTNQLVLSYNGNIGVGTSSPAYKLDVNGDINVAAGNAYKYAGANVVTAQPSLGNYFFGSAGNFSMTGTNNYAVGGLFSNTSGFNNVAMGVNALSQNTTGVTNTSVGGFSLQANTVGSGNTALGYTALAQSTGALNLGLGYHAGGNITTGSNNIMIGNDVNPSDPTASNQLNIGNTIYGNLSNGSVGIGTTSPSSKLSVGGNGLIGGNLTVTGLATLTGLTIPPASNGQGSIHFLTQPYNSFLEHFDIEILPTIQILNGLNKATKVLVVSIIPIIHRWH